MAVCTGDQTSPPDLYKFEKETANITEKINKLQRQLDHSTTGNKQITDQLHAAGIKLENAEEERRKIVAQQKTIEDSIRKLGQSFLKQRELVNHLVVGLRYKTEGAYNEQILKLESQLEASHFSFNDRKKLQQTVESLKEGKDKLKDYLEAKQVMDDCRNEQDAMRKEKDVLFLKNKLSREKITNSRDEITRLREELENNKSLQREKKTIQDAITREINDLYQQRKQISDEFRKKQSDYMKYMKTVQTIKQQQQHKPIERTTKPVKQNLLGVSTGLVQKESSFDEERGICHTLITYLSRLNGASPTVPLRSSTYSSQTPPSPSPEISRSHSQMSYRKNEEEEEWLPAGQRDKRERKKSKRRKSFSGSKTSHKPLHHNATIFDQFNQVGLHPPIASADIPTSIEQLRNKLIQYNTLKAESEAGDSGIMSSTGISEYSDMGVNEPTLTSGEVTPNRRHPSNSSPSPPPILQDDQIIKNSTTTFDNTNSAQTTIEE